MTEKLSLLDRLIVGVIYCVHPSMIGRAMLAHGVIWISGTSVYLLSSANALDRSTHVLPLVLGGLAVTSVFAGLDVARWYRPARYYGAVVCLAWLTLASAYFVEYGQESLQAAGEDVLEFCKLLYLALCVLVHLLALGTCVLLQLDDAGEKPVSRWKELVSIWTGAFDIGTELVLTGLVIGFLGSLGGLGLYQLLEDPRYKVHILVSAVLVVAALFIWWRPFREMGQDLWPFGLIFWGMTLGLSAWNASEFYWDQRLPRTADVEVEALQLTRLLADDPGNARLHAHLAASYARMGLPISAVIVMRTYNSILANNKYQNFHEQITNRKQSIARRYDETLEEVEKALTRSSKELLKMTERAVSDRSIRLQRELVPAEILLSPAAPGEVLNIDQIEESDLTSTRCDSNAKGRSNQSAVQCGRIFATGSLRRAVQTGVADVKHPEDGDCCQILLSDPDLKLLREVDANDSSLLKDKRARSEFLAVATRMLFKQYYLRNYARNAPF